MTWRAALATALWLLLASIVGGCANLPFLSAQTDAEAPPKPEPQFRLEVDAPPALRRLLLEHLDLARLQHAPEAEALSGGELDRLIGAASVQAHELLQTEGYFAPEVRVQRVADGASPPLLRVSVVPGPQARVERVTFEVQGELAERADAGDADAAKLLAAVRDEWPLDPGRPFDQAAWDAAKNGAVAALRREGYLLAGWAGTAAQVDPETNTVRIFVVADSGALFRVGPIRVTGLERHDEGAVLPLARELRGKPATERRLRETQERLLQLGLFDSVVIDVDANAPDASAAPLTVAVRELSMYVLTLGVGFVDNTGFQVSAEHVARRVFDTRWVAVNKLQFGPNLNSWQGDLMSHLQPDGYRWLLAVQAEDLVSADETRLSGRLRAGRTRDSDRIWRLIYGEYAWARVDTSAGQTVGSAVSGNYNWVWRDIDDLRTPTQGYVWSLQGALGWTSGSVTPVDGDKTDSSGPFARAYGRVTGFWKLGEKWYANARAELGEVFVRRAYTVPDTLLFRAGGDGSVRGYAYRTLGPEVDGVVVSGTTLFTASVQLERAILANHPEFLGMVFVDAGNASDGWSDMRPAFGYGAGVNWRSPVGPLQVYLAYGQEERRLRLGFSVGVVF